MSAPDSDQNSEPVSVLVSRSSTEINKTSAKSFQFSIPSLSNGAAIQPQLPNLFQATGKSIRQRDHQELPQSKVLAAPANVCESPINGPQLIPRQGSDSHLRKITSAVPKPNIISDPNYVLVSRRQEKNSLLRYIRNIRWRFADQDSLLCDYLVGSSAAVLYLTLRYHLQCPEYIHARMGPLKHSYRLRILLVLVDMEDVGNVIEDLTRIAFINNWTMVCAFSIPEAAQYIETFKAQENAPFDSIKERIESDHASIFSSILTLIRSVNKTDVVTLAQAFGSLSNIMAASVDELSQCPGIGALKAARIYEAFHQPFRQER